MTIYKLSPKVGKTIDIRGEGVYNVVTVKEMKRKAKNRKVLEPESQGSRLGEIADLN